MVGGPAPLDDLALQAPFFEALGGGIHIIREKAQVSRQWPLCWGSRFIRFGWLSR
jgi:hypothetical protein